MTSFQACSFNRWRSALTGRWQKALYWSKILGQFGSIQMIVQAVGLASGILLVRSLSKTDYAYFTLANTMQATMTTLADCGISSGLSAIGGRVWHDRFRFGQLINTALRLRRSLLIVSALVISPILFWMLLANGASAAYAGCLTLVVAIGLNFQLTSGVLAVVPRLHLQVGRLQKLDFCIALARIGILFLAYFILLNAITAVLATIITYVIISRVLKRWAGQSVDLSAPVSKDDWSAFWAIAKKQAPNDIYYCVQGQIMIWLISIFGTAKNLADIGALGRLAVIFAIISSTMTSVILPRFARCQSAKTLRLRYLQILGVFALFGLGLVALAVLFPGQLLFILGPKYMHLKSEVVYMIISSVIGGLNGLMWSCNLSKGWIPSSWINIPVGLGAQILLIFIFDISTVKGVLLMNIFTALAFIIVNSCVAILELCKLDSAV